MQRANHLLHALRGALASSGKTSISQKKLAELLGLAEPTMSRWMSGKIKLGQIELLLRFIEKVPEDRWRKEIAGVLSQAKGTHYLRSKKR